MKKLFLLLLLTFGMTNLSYSDEVKSKIFYDNQVTNLWLVGGVINPNKNPVCFAQTEFEGFKLQMALDLKTNKFWFWMRNKTWKDIDSKENFLIQINFANKEGLIVEGDDFAAYKIGDQVEIDNLDFEYIMSRVGNLVRMDLIPDNDLANVHIKIDAPEKITKIFMSCMDKFETSGG